MNEPTPTLERLRAAAAAAHQDMVDDHLDSLIEDEADRQADEATESRIRLEAALRLAEQGERKGLVLDADDNAEYAEYIWEHFTIQIPANAPTMPREELFNLIASQAMEQAYEIYYNVAGLPLIEAHPDVVEDHTSDFHLTDPDERH